MKTSRLISNITGSLVQPNKSIVGANAFAHEAGIHQDGMLKMKRTYEIMDAEMIGLSENKLVLGKHSGRHAFSERLRDMGYSLTQDDLNSAFDRFKRLADKKKEILEDDLHAIISDEVYSAPEIYGLVDVQVSSGLNIEPQATVILTKDNHHLEDKQTGAGTVDAIYKTIDHLIGEHIDLVDYVIQAVTEGTDALADVTVHIRDNNRIFSGRGSTLDVLVSSTKAYLDAINKMLSARETKRIKPTL